MKNNTVRNLLVSAAVILLGTVALSYVYNLLQSQTTQIGMSFREELVRPDSPALGPENAPLTIVEFLDPECESCKAFYPIMKNFLDENKKNVRFVVRYMPFHTSSAMAIAGAESARLQGKYWEYLESLFTYADDWGHKPAPDPAYFEKYASDLGLNMEQFKKDMADPRWAALIQREMADGQTMGVRATPTVFLNGEILRGLDPSTLERTARAHLGGQKQFF